MEWFFGGVSKPESNDTVKVLLERIKTSTIIEDKHDSILQLSDLSQDAKQFQNYEEDTVKILLDFVKNNKERHELTRLILSSFLNLSSSKKFIELFIKQENIFIILECLEKNESDYIKYHTIQLLTTLLKHNTEAVQQVILSEPIGVARIIDVLQNNEEIIRNESLLLLNTLTKARNVELLKIIAFEGAFEKLFEIIQEEGGNEGGVIVQDCLQIIHNLVRCSSNQKYFREIGCIPYLKTLLDVPVANGEVQYLSDRKQSILISALNIFVDLVEPSDQLEANKNIICKSKALNSIIIFALGDNVPPNISCLALYILGCCVYQHRASQECLESYNFNRRNDVIQSALVCLCRLACYEQKERRRRCAYYCIQKYLYENTEGQLMVASTVKPATQVVSETKEGMLCGITIANSLFALDKPKFHPLESLHAAQILSIVICQNIKCKEILIAMPYEVKNNNQYSFFEWFVKTTVKVVKARMDDKISIGFLKLLCEWILDSSTAAKIFLKNLSDLQFFIDLVNKEVFHIHIQGLSSLLVSLLIMEYEDGDSDITKDSLTKMLINQIGLSKLKERWNSLQQSVAYQKAKKGVDAKSLLNSNELDEWNIYDEEFVKFCENCFALIEEYVKSPKTFYKPTPKIITTPNKENKKEQIKHTTKEEEIIKKYKEMIQEQDKEILKVKEENSKLLSRIKTFEEEHARISEYLKKLEQEKALDEEKISKNNEIVKSLNLKIAEYEERIKNLQNETAEKIKEFNIRHSLSQDAINNLNFQLEEKKREVESLGELYKQAIENIKEKHEEYEALQKRFNELEKQLKETRPETPIQPIIVQENLDQVEKLEKEIRNKEEQINKLNMTIESLKKENEEKMKNIQPMENTSSIDKQTIEEQRKRIFKLESELTPLMQENLNQKAYIQTLQQQIDELHKAQRSNEQEKLNLAKIQVLEQRITELNNLLMAKQQKILELEEENNDMLDIIEKLEKKINV